MTSRCLVGSGGASGKGGTGGSHGHVGGGGDGVVEQYAQLKLGAMDVAQYVLATAQKVPIGSSSGGS